MGAKGGDTGEEKKKAHRVKTSGKKAKKKKESRTGTSFSQRFFWNSARAPHKTVAIKQITSSSVKIFTGELSDRLLRSFYFLPIF